MEVTTNADGSPMTVADATSIADSAQESLVKLVLSSLSSDDVLLADQGVSLLVWLLCTSNSVEKIPAPHN